MTPRPLDSVTRLPELPGVYRFRDVRRRALYVGRAVRLRRRVGSYWNSLGDRVHLAPMVARIDTVEAVVCDSEHEAAWLERNLLESSMPPWNRTRGGQEVPVHIRLDAGGASPGLTVVHAPPSPTAPSATALSPTALSPTAPSPRWPSAAGETVRYFGPHLGGDRVRLAVAALHRVLPLAYTGTGLTGFQRDMASVREVGTGDRAAMAEALTAVLCRDPAAVSEVRAQLRERRDRAAEALAFELAARLRDEMDALDWVTCPQRVSVAEPRDFEASGWAAGILVSFRVRAGRLGTWTQRPCTRANAVRRLAGTPADWVDFAHRNAELAARLAG